MIRDLTQKETEEINISPKGDYLITSSQKAIKNKISQGRAYLLAPNFMRYSRLLSSGKYVECLKEFMKNMSFGKNLMLNVENIGMLVPIGGVFWPAILEMLMVDLSSVKKNENVIINPYLIDLALHSERKDIIKKAILLAKSSTEGKVGIWTKNANLLLSNFSLEELGIDFMVTPLNKFGAGMRVDENILIERLEKNKIELIRDYVSHFQSFSKEINAEKEAIIRYE